MSLRNETTTKLLAAVAALDLADHRLKEGAAVWPSADCDMTVHEIDEARRLISGMSIRLRTEIANLQPTRQRAVGNA